MKTLGSRVAGVRSADKASTLEAHLRTRSGDPEPRERATVADPVELFAQLEASGKFHRDRGLGRIYHPGSLSLRENVRENSLHISIDGNHVSAHVDRVSPLGGHPEKRSRYALARVALHNAYGIAADVGRLLRGRQGDHRCELDCEWEPEEERPAKGSKRKLKLLDPTVSPWSVHLEARVAGRLDEARLRSALATVAPAPAPDGPDVLDVVDCPDDRSLADTRSEFQAVPVPVTDSPPVRVRLARHPSGDVVMLNVNHAAADLHGALAVLSALARGYAGDGEGALPLDFLAVRDLPVRPAAPMVRTVEQLYRVVLGRVRDVLTGTTRLMPDQSRQEQGHGFHLVTVGADDPASLMRAPDRDTDNDVLLAALHLTVAAWNTEHGHRDGRIAVLVPVDLRNHPWPREVVGNFSVTARVSTSPRDRASPTATLAAVTEQTARNIRTRTGHALIEALARHGLLPLWARQSVIVLAPLTANHLVDSAVLSYVGRLDDLPSFGPDAGETTEVWLSAPSRMPHGLSVGGVVVNDRLHLVFRYPHQLFGPDAVRRFAQSYLAQLRLVVATPLSRR